MTKVLFKMHAILPCVGKCIFSEKEGECKDEGGMGREKKEKKRRERERGRVKDRNKDR